MPHNGSASSSQPDLLRPETWTNKLDYVQPMGMLWDTIARVKKLQKNVEGQKS